MSLLFAQVLHPANPDTLGHQFWQQNCPNGRSAGLVSVVFDKRYSWTDICRFVIRFRYLNWALAGAVQQAWSCCMT